MAAFNHPAVQSSPNVAFGQRVNVQTEHTGITDKPSTRVHAAPGGNSSLNLFGGTDAPHKALLDWHSALARVCVRWQGGYKIAWAWDWWRGGEGTGRSRPAKHAVHAARLVRCTSRARCECAQMVLTVARSLGTEEAGKLSLRAVACLLSYLQVPRLCPITLVRVL